VSPTSTYAQFTFVVKLLHINSFGWISNVTLNAMMKLLQKEFVEACPPDSFNEAMMYLRSMGLFYEKSMFAKIIVYYFARRCM
jgi:hypothetical protein